MVELAARLDAVAKGVAEVTERLRAAEQRLAAADAVTPEQVRDTYLSHLTDRWNPWDALSDTGRAAWVSAAAVARGEIDPVRPLPRSPWTPGVGRWARIRPGADRQDVPEGVDRVLVLSATDSDDEVKVGWPGDAMPDRTAWEYLPAASLAPVQPRTWERAEDVPRHVVARDRNGIIAPRSLVGDEVLQFVGPYREVLPDGGAL